MIFFLASQIKSYFPQNHQGFNQLMALQGEVFRQMPGRCTQRIRLGEKNYFIKQHFGVGWKEIVKNLMLGRLPILGAKHEWRAIQYLQSLNISTPLIAAYGCHGHNPAQQQSFILTEALPPTISLEDYCRDWRHQPPAFSVKQHLIKEVAKIARTMHQHGVNHRDFYLCHFLWEIAAPHTLYLIDCHRAQIHTKLPQRWQIKDLAGLYFSSKNIGLTPRDLLRFMKHYRQHSLRHILSTERHFWQTVNQRGEKLYQKHENHL